VVATKLAVDEWNASSSVLTAYTKTGAPLRWGQRNNMDELDSDLQGDLKTNAAPISAPISPPINDADDRELDRHHLSVGRSFVLVHSRLHRRHLDRHHLAIGHPLRGAVLAAHLLHRRRLSRYFSHRAYATSRLFQLVLAVGAQSTAQKSVLWWATQHRHHHLHSDTERDLHSPRQKGFIYSHVGWIFARRQDSLDPGSRSRNFAKFPELMWLHRFELLPAVALAVTCYLVAGWPGLVVGFFWSNGAGVPRHLLHQFTGACARAQALRDRRRFPQQLAARALHHGRGLAQQSSCLSGQRPSGLQWWELDLTYLCAQALVLDQAGLDLKTPPRAVVRNEHGLDHG